MKHTKGPWKVFGTLVISQTEDMENRGNTVVCETRQPAASGLSEVFPNYDEDVANARLIAAAPELLEACIQSIKYLDQTGWYKSYPTKIAKLLKDVIKKAEGNDK